ncbi:phage major capsid protein [Bradyrhizobium cytisi]|uniref:Phage major capsid protein n=1 Tax=Bradyrhizobium cytisi TaxID=515489 RepID=A0A5S4X0D8_9BRAD|nr:phage major capsid protein [Bradyrhizobium cytisi]TYL87427.1 phage major capsid protein [Bradyrhizobium cytisi]
MRPRTKQSAQRQDIEPEDDESYSDFMDRCTDEIGDEDVCQIIWDNRAAEGVRHKTHAAKVNGFEFVLSDETPDRMDDIIMSDGWQLSNFKKNPIALFGHQSSFPIGTWKTVRVVDKQLRGVLELAPLGTSERIDEIRRLVEADILRAVSVGFRPIETKPREETDWGVFFTKAELVETSVVSVPANPNALAVAKSLNISPATIDLVFAGKGTKGGIQRRGLTGGQASTSSLVRKGTTMSFAQRITAAEQRLVAFRDQLAAHWETTDETDVSDEAIKIADEINQNIAREERTLAALRDTERHLGATSDDAGSRAVVIARTNNGQLVRPHAEPVRPFALPKKKIEPQELLVRMGVVQLLQHQTKKPLDVVIREVYGDDETLPAMFDWMSKAATAPAATNVVGWAQELVQQIYVAFMETLMPKSVYPRLSGYGLSLSFGTSGKIVIPTRSLTPTIAGSFVGEGLPIPVRQGAFTSQTLTPKKMAVITTWTREINEHSVPAIEGLLRTAIQEDTAISLDTVLLDSNPATVVRPPGILNGVVGLTPTAGGGFNALVGDIKQISGALLTGTRGNVRTPVWLMNPQQVNSIGLVAAPGMGIFPFREEVAAGQLGGWPIIDSGTVPLGTVIALDAADFVTAGGDAPRFEMSDQATLHFEDTTPLDIGTAGTPPVVAAPVKSLWQTDSLALRLILPINWTIRRTGVVAYVAGVTW